MVPTKESRRSSLVVHVGLQTIRTDGATEWKYDPPHSKNEIQSWSQLIATIECLYLQVPRRRVDLYRNQLAKNKAFSSVYFIFRRSFNGLVRLFRSAPK